MDDRRQRREGTGAHVGGAAGDGGGGGDATKQRCNQVAQALANQLGIGVVLAAGHAVGHHRAEQRFDGAEHGDGKRGRQQLANQLKRQAQGLAIGRRQLPGPGEVRQKGRNPGMQHTVEAVAETLAQGCQRNAHAFQGQAGKRAHGQGRQVARHFWHPARPEDQHRQAQRRHQGVAEMGAGQGQQQNLHLLQVVQGLAAQAEAEQILELQGGNHDADASGKTQGYRVGHEFDQAAGAAQAHGDHDQAGKHGAQQQAAEAELLGDRQQDHHKGGGRPGDVEARAAGEGDQRCGHQHRVQAILRGHADGNGQGHGQGNGDDAYRQARRQVATQGLE